MVKKEPPTSNAQHRTSNGKDEKTEGEHRRGGDGGMLRDGVTGGDYWGVGGRTAMHIMRPIVPISSTTEPVASISK